MFRKLLLPTVALALLAGCVTTAPHGYRAGGAQGDYYYGRPSVQYRYSGYPGYGYPGYGYPYGYGSYGSGLSIWGGYGSFYAPSHGGGFGGRHVPITHGITPVPHGGGSSGSHGGSPWRHIGGGGHGSSHSSGH